MLVSVCTPTLRKEKEWHATFNDDGIEQLYSGVFGVGAARRELCSRAKGEVIVMLDDDVVLNSGVFGFLCSTPRGCFVMAHVDGHVSTRVFAIHREDYLRTKGFDSEIRYVFEDGAFYVEAVKAGLKPLFLSANNYVHKPHVNRTGDCRRFKSWFEHGKMLVKYTHLVYPGLVGFFGFRSLLREPDVFLVKFFSVIYWLVRGVKNEFKQF